METSAGRRAGGATLSGLCLAVSCFRVVEVKGNLFRLH